MGRGSHGRRARPREPAGVPRYGLPPLSAALVRRSHRELLAARDPAVVDGFFGDGFVSHNMPPGFPPGREGVKRFFSMFRDAFPDVTVEIDELVEEGERVAVATTF